MNAQPRPLPAASANTDDTPLLRTLLLTDLCDSTEITEKRGDTAAAQIFRDLDRVVLELQQRWRGRQALRWTFAGYTLLGLSYFGSKLILENILGKHWG